MKNGRFRLDEMFEPLMRTMWVILVFSAFRLLGTVAVWYFDADAAVGLYRRFPEMLEHLLAGVVVTLALGAALQYFAFCERS